MNIVKHGKTAPQKPRYLGQNCRRQFIRAYTYLGCGAAGRALLMPLTRNGAGSRAIERVLLGSRHSVRATLCTAAAQVAVPTLPRRGRALELDECWSFVRSKKPQRWTWLAFDRVRRAVIACVNERRTEGACQKLLKQRANCQVRRDYTDDWPADKKFLPAKQHQVGKERGGTLSGIT